MTRITKLDDIEIYTDSLDDARKIYQLVRDKKLVKEYSLIDQIKRASLSIPANIAEGYGRNTKKDFSHFLSIALGSVNEVLVYLDFIHLEFGIEVEQLKQSYIILTKRIHSFRTYLLK